MQKNKCSILLGKNKFLFPNSQGLIILFLLLLGLPHREALAQIAASKDRFIGNVIGNNFRENFTQYWNQVTPENAGKWGSVEGSQDSYNWTQLDAIYEYAMTKDILFKHHALVWGNQAPTWIDALDSASQRAQVEEWIRLVGQRYPGMVMVDVVNEPFHAPPSFKNALGGDGASGWDWIITAFQWARQYCTRGVKLILNEYSVLHDNTVTSNYLKIIDTLKVRGLIDGIGIQGHYFEFKGSGYTNSPVTIAANLNRLVATGLPVYITEFDINEADNNNQLSSYKTYFPIFWDNPGVMGITLWGYVQYEIWKTDAWLMTSAGVERPAMAWLKNYVVAPPVPVLVSPNATEEEIRNPIFKWRTSRSATLYRLQVSTSTDFSAPVLDTTIADTVFKVNSLSSFSLYRWRVSASNNKGTSDYSNSFYFVTGDQYVSVEGKDDGKTLRQLVLSQNYPNPFNPTTAIDYQVPASSFVSLKVIDMLGREIRILVNEPKSAGSYSVTFDGSTLPSGVYFYQLKADNYIATKKLVLLK
jgi:endo-1,4-beta-xylanase